MHTLPERVPSSVPNMNTVNGQQVHSQQPQGASELLFFDTFSHDSGEKLNLDLVQFPRPVIIDEVRVIPLGGKVPFPEMAVTGTIGVRGVRLGATNPTNFELEFFVNDLARPGLPTFESLGNLHYNQNQSIHLKAGKVR